jgi:hydrogenase maturation protease
MDELRKLADAVLYEGYILWPYRRTALKNQRRWTFGGVFPPSHTEAHPDDLSRIQAQCLLETEGEPDVEVSVRFLQVVARRLFDAAGRPVDALEAGGTRYTSWEEATERESCLARGRAELAIEAGEAEEALPGAGRIVRSWRALRGSAAVDVEQCGDRVHRVTARVSNETPWRGADREDALRSTFCSTHMVLTARGGAFVSPTDPPDELREPAGDCENVGVWPVLVGENGSRETLFASPIILSDYPEIAPESPGDLFDGGEIDRLLILNVLSLTDAEQEEMRASDARAREILDRCAALGPEELLALHGRLTELR